MGLSPKEQVIDQINKSKSILICVSENPSGDALGSALALYLSLGKMGKKADVVSPTAVSEKYSFLPSSNEIASKVEGVRNYVLSIDMEEEKLQQLSYEVRDNKLRIFITAKNSGLEEKNVTLESSKFNYDLIVVLDTPDLENLGSAYDENPELFYETPVINIDHSPSNEYFGKINFVDVTASSTSEIVFEIVSELGEELFYEHIATNLLAGIISATESFRNRNTTPRAFLTAASLISKGANKQEIIKHLYKTKSVSTLKLMGKIMSGLKYNSKYKLGWSLIEEGDFEKSNTSPESLRSIVKELISSSPEFNLVLVLYKNGGRINGIVNFTEKLPIGDLVKSLSGRVDNSQITFVSEENDLELAEKDVLRKIKIWADNMPDGNYKQ